MMIKCLERATVFSNDSSFLVKLNILHDRIGLNAEDTDFQLSSQDSIPCESRCGDFCRQTIGLKITSVLDLIKRLATNTVLLHFADPSRAMIIEPEPQPEVEDVTMLVMPMIY
jgi:DNA polymerase III sliding clamp (beta) subunit (PCNA family)